MPDREMVMDSAAMANRINELSHQIDEAKKLFSEISESKILTEDGYGEGIRLQGEVKKFIEMYGSPS
jgi:hypothetical protein